MSSTGIHTFDGVYVTFSWCSTSTCLFFAWKKSLNCNFTCLEVYQTCTCYIVLIERLHVFVKKFPLKWMVMPIDNKTLSLTIYISFIKYNVEPLEKHIHIEIDIW